MSDEEFDNEKFNILIDDVLEDMDKNDMSEAFFYAFKAKIIPKCPNPYITLSYNFYETSMNSKSVINAIRQILEYLRNVKFAKKKKVVFSPYKINNSKTVIDFIKLENYDFTDDDILNGINKELNADSYKIEYLLNSIQTNYCIAKSKKDYRGLRHTALKLKTKNYNITIINKGSPIYRSRGLMYMVDFPEDDGEIETTNFKPIKNNLFKIPFYPHVLIIGEYCFFIYDKIESVFGFEEFNKRQAQLFLTELPRKVHFDSKSLEFINSFVNKNKNYNYFADFNDERLKLLYAKDKKLLNVVKQDLELSLNNDIPVINNLNEAESLISFLCGNIKKDIYTDEKVIAVNYKPLKKKL